MARIDKTTRDGTYAKLRGWGYELWIENCLEYCGKILHLYEGKRGSLHFHIDKKETMYLQSGKVTLRLIDPDDGSEYFVNLDPGDNILISPGQVHQIIAVEESDLFEFSTMHQEADSHRVQKGD